MRYRKKEIRCASYVKRHQFLASLCVLVITMLPFVLILETAKLEKVKQLAIQEAQSLQHTRTRRENFTTTSSNTTTSDIFLDYSFLETPFSRFMYPLNINMSTLITKYKQNRTIYYRIINQFPHKFIINSSELCNTQVRKPILVLFLIKSGVENLERRRIIRKTWANESINRSFLIKHVFLVGTDGGKNFITQYNIHIEDQLHKDVVQMNFIDSDENSAAKTLGGLIWAVEYCKEAKFVLLVEDDLFVATNSLVDYLTDLEAYKIDRLYMGNVLNFHRPDRTNKSKRNVTLSEYPYDKYPPFVTAGAILMSMSFVVDFNIAMRYTKQFKYDDIFIGIVAYKLGYMPVGNPRFYTTKVQYKSSHFRDVLTSPGYGNPQEIYNAWFCITYRMCHGNQRYW